MSRAGLPLTREEADILAELTAEAMAGDPRPDARLASLHRRLVDYVVREDHMERVAKRLREG